MPLKYLSNFWRSLQTPLVNCKIELKLWREKYCILSANSNDNDDANSNNIIFTIKDTKLYVPFITLSAKDNQKLSKFPSKGFERSVYWNDYKTKHANKHTTQQYRHFLESNFVGVNRLFVLVYSYQDENSKRFITRRYYLPKDIIDNCKVIIKGKNFYDQPIDSNTKRYKEMRKLTSGQGEDYTVYKVMIISKIIPD